MDKKISVTTSPIMVLVLAHCGLYFLHLHNHIDAIFA